MSAAAMPIPLAASLPVKISISRRLGASFKQIAKTNARINESWSKGGNSHTVVIPYRTDVRVGDIIRAGSRRLAIVSFADLTGKRLFLKIDADADTAARSLRSAARLASIAHSEGE